MTWVKTIEAVIGLCDDQAEILAHAEMPWHSGSFRGRRHVLTLDFAGAPAIGIGEAFLDLFPDYPFALPGHTVASQVIVWRNFQGGADPRLTAQVELLLVQDEKIAA